MYGRFKAFIKFTGSRRFAIVLLVLTAVIILVSNLLPNPAMLSTTQLDILKVESPLIYKLSRRFHMMALASNPFFLVIPLLSILSISVCTYLRTLSYLRSRESFGVIPELSAMKIRESLFCNEGADLKQKLVDRGWKVEGSKVDDADILIGRKGAGGFWGSVVFHIGMIVVIIGTLFSMATSYEGIITLTEGFTRDTLGLFPEDMKEERSAFPFQSMELEEFRATYSDENFPLDYSAAIKTVGRKGEREKHQVKINLPLKREGVNFVLIKYSFAPRFIVTEKTESDDNVVEDAYVNLTVTSTDQLDSFQLPDIGIKVEAKFFPDFEMEEERLLTKSKLPKNPVFLLTFYRWDEKIGSGILPLAKRMDFFNGRYTIEFRDLREWVTLSVSQDSGLGVVVAGLFIIVLGLIVRFAQNERKIWLIMSEENGRRMVGLGGKTAYFPAQFEDELGVIAEDISVSPDKE